MAGPWNNLGDPEAFAGLPLPASPVTASGEDPDEVRERMAAQGGQPWRGTPWAMPYNPKADSIAAANGVIASAPKPGPAAAPPAGGPEANSLNADVERQAMSGQLTSGQKLATIGDQMQPNPQIEAVEQQRLQDAVAAPNAKDPRYKAGFGTRLLRGLQGVGLGLAEHGIMGSVLGGVAPQYVGGTSYGAPTDAYDTALAKNRQQVAQDTDRLATLEGDFKRAQDLRVAQEKAAQESGEAFKGAGATATTQQGEETKAAEVPIHQQEADTAQRNAYNVSPEGKLKITQAEIDARTRYADQMRMPPGYLRTRYVLTGDLQAAREPSAEEIAVNRIASTWRQQHGGQGPQTVDDWQQIYAAAKGGTKSGGGDDTKNLRTAASLAEKRVKDLTALMGSRGAALWSDQERQQHQQDLDDANEEAETLRRQLTASPGGPTLQPAQAGAPGGQPNAAEGQFSPDGKKVMQGGKWVPATGGDGMVRMKIPDPQHPGQFRVARFAPDKAPQAAQLGAVFAGGQ